VFQTHQLESPLAELLCTQGDPYGDSCTQTATWEMTGAAAADPVHAMLRRAAGAVGGLAVVAFVVGALQQVTTARMLYGMLSPMRYFDEHKLPPALFASLGTHAVHAAALLAMWAGYLAAVRGTVSAGTLVMFDWVSAHRYPACAPHVGLWVPSLRPCMLVRAARTREPPYPLTVLVCPHVATSFAALQYNWESKYYAPVFREGLYVAVAASLFQLAATAVCASVAACKHTRNCTPRTSVTVNNAQGAAYYYDPAIEDATVSVGGLKSRFLSPTRSGVGAEEYAHITSPPSTY
jgi:hypothetical protein